MSVVTDSPLVDFHCHVDLYKDHAALIEESDRCRIYTLAVTTTPKAWRRNRALARESKFVRVALGLHPQLVGERANELQLWKDLLPEARYVGEVGLDAGPRFFRSLDLQKEVFASILRECAMHRGRILSVHSVRSVKTVLDMIETHLAKDHGKVVLHWYTGTKAEARRAADLGCYFSINGEMLRSDRHRDLVAGLPLERLLTETDGPFTRTERGIVRPRDVEALVGVLAGVREMQPASMRHVLASNLRAVVATDGDP